MDEDEEDMRADSDSGGEDSWSLDGASRETLAKQIADETANNRARAPAEKSVRKRQVNKLSN
jgi:hypothetical protein